MTKGPAMKWRALLRGLTVAVFLLLAAGYILGFVFLTGGRW